MALTDGEWRKASFSSSGCVFFSGDCASGVLAVTGRLRGGCGLLRYQARSGGNEQKSCEKKPCGQLIDRGTAHCATSVAATLAGRTAVRMREVSSPLIDSIWTARIGALWSISGRARADALLRGLPNLLEGGIALGVPLLQFLLAEPGKISALAARSFSS